jgi:acyl-[acyl-carrier-protein]-phospholipid O-acyltransferase/long-chain-fatty-acid--[acyl-carrier-protein] ligase
MLFLSSLGNGKPLVVCFCFVNPIINKDLGQEIFDSLRNRPFRPFLMDYGFSSPKGFSRGMVLALSLKLIKVLNQRKVGKYVGVVLPPGLGGFVANFALILSGRIPVNLNFTQGADLNQYILSITNIQTILTASKVVHKFPEFPWPEDLFWIDRYLTNFSKHPFGVLVTFARLWLRPERVRKEFLFLPENESETAVILFTSGSSGKPKGVRLSHRNILYNCRQLSGLDLFQNGPKVLVNLPLFHSFGFTVGMVFSTVRGLPLVCAPSPLNHRLNLKAITNEQVEILLGTPTFLRGYLQQARKEELKSIRYVVAGAEKSSAKFRSRWESTVECEYLEGYGLTETSPALSFNLPGSGKKDGSVGRLLPGVECKTLDVESGEQTDSLVGGILCFRGGNVFDGYWQDDGQTNAVLDADGWFKTGDLGRLDEEGFLWIEGRISRFSKIGGEMVSHQMIEEAITHVLHICPGQDLPFVVTAREHDQKGEEIILVSTLSLDLHQIQKALRADGVPNLWIPRDYISVKAIPILSTGKVSWGEIRKLIQNFKIG